MAAVTGILLYKRYSHTVARYFIWFLVYVALLELIGFYPVYFAKYDLLHIIKDTIFEDNYWYYTVFWSVGSVLFFVFYYHEVLRYNPYKATLKYGGFLFLISAIMYILTHIESFFSSQLVFITIFGLCLILLSVVFYFIEILLTNRILTFYRSLNFYISATLLIWWLVTTPLFFLISIFLLPIGILYF